MKSLSAVAWVVLAAVALAGCSKKEEGKPPAASNGPEKFAFTPKYPVGKRLLQRESSRINVRAQADALGGQTDFEVSKDLAITVEAKREGGGYDLEAEFTAQRILIVQVGRSAVDFDSSRDLAEDARHAMAREFRKVIGQKLKLTTDASGQVTNLPNHREFIENVTGGAGPQALAVMSGFYSEPVLRETGFQRPCVPAQPVALGESWPARLPGGMPSQFKGALRYTFKGWEVRGGHKCAVWEGSGGISASDLPAPDGGDGMAGTPSTSAPPAITFSGAAVFDMEWGMVIEDSLKLSAGTAEITNLYTVTEPREQGAAAVGTPPR